MTTPLPCPFCGESWWDAHVCASSLKLKPVTTKKLQVTLQDDPRDAEVAQYKRMFEAACVDLGLINEALGLDPNDGGAGPILGAIAGLNLAAQPDCRTCKWKFDGDFLDCVCSLSCVNGNRYQPAPAVVLWRTEP